VTCSGATYTYNDASWPSGITSEQTINETVSIDGAVVATGSVNVNPLGGGTTTSTVSFSVPSGTHSIALDAFDQTLGVGVEVAALASGQTASNGFFPVTQSVSCGSNDQGQDNNDQGQDNNNQGQDN
jgi:hypothetical protein